MINVDTPPEQYSAVARKLLDAAEGLGLAPQVVATHSDGLYGQGFLVPREVAEKAGFSLDLTDDEDPEGPEPKKRGRPKKVVDQEVPALSMEPEASDV